MGTFVLLVSREVKYAPFARGEALIKRNARFSRKISTETKLDARKKEMMVPTTNGHAHPPHPTKIHKCPVFNENRRQDHI